MSEMISAVTQHLSHACSQEALAVTWILTSLWKYGLLAVAAAAAAACD